MFNWFNKKATVPVTEVVTPKFKQLTPEIKQAIDGLTEISCLYNDYRSCGDFFVISITLTKKIAIYKDRISIHKGTEIIRNTDSSAYDYIANKWDMQQTRDLGTFVALIGVNEGIENV